MPFVNRCVVVVRPGPRFVDWVHALDEEDGVEPAEASAIRGETIAYLAPEVETPGDVERFLKKQARRMFEDLLEGWCVDREQWPKQRGIKSFEKWVEWELHDYVVDLDGAPLVSDSSTDQPGFVDEPFDFHAALHDPDGYISDTRGPIWVAHLYEQFASSKEAEGLRYVVGWTEVLFHYLHGYEGITIHDLTPELLEYALLVHFPRKITDPSFDAEAVLAEFGALFEFMKRAYKLENASACLALLRRKGMADAMDKAMSSSDNFGMAKRMMAGLDPFGGGGFSPIQHPFVSNEPEVGRNDACPCGSGKKYKRCCLKKA
ncbi:YecA family protein [Lujinxingia vulgaris]|nr:SEC-C metal-binding domain-containing protein [Lujinxingia vulgaris]